MIEVKLNTDQTAMTTTEVGYAGCKAFATFVAQAIDIEARGSSLDRTVLVPNLMTAWLKHANDHLVAELANLGVLKTSAAPNSISAKTGAEDK